MSYLKRLEILDKLLFLVVGKRCAVGVALVAVAGLSGVEFEWTGILVAQRGWFEVACADA